MKAYEFPMKVTPEGTIAVPEALVKQLPDDATGRVIILLPEHGADDEQDSWTDMIAEQFFARYREDDAIYDHIVHV